MKVKRKVVSLFIVLAIFALSATIHYHNSEGEWVFKWQEEIHFPSYRITAALDVDTMTITATQDILFKNSSENSLSHIYFHLYPNTFRSIKTAPFEENELNIVYPNGFNPGWIEIDEVRTGKKEMDYRIMGDALNLLRVTPRFPLAAGDNIEISMKFRVKIPNAIGRFGYGEDTINITNWYPILSMHDENGWNLDPYHSIGDPFYSGIASYKVSFSIDENYILATTGNINRKTVTNGIKTYEITAENVRDFAMVASENFKLLEESVNGITVKVYYLSHKGQLALEYAVAAVNTFNKLFGIYPYQQLSVVASDFYLGGMEYPNLVMISKELFQLEEDFPLEYVIVHEIAHQWWYGIVGNNGIKEPWLDEALTEYSTLMYFEFKYGKHIKEQIFEKMIKAQYENFININIDKGEGILRSIREFESNFEYSSIVYSKGAMFIEELRNLMGDEDFIKALREYFKEYKFSHATTINFYNIMARNTQKDVKTLFNQWIKDMFE